MDLLHLLQQTINALQISAFYALLAVAYVLLHGVTNRFNLSFGAIVTWAGYVAIGLCAGLFQTTFWSPGEALLAALAAALLSGAALGLLLGRAVMLPIMNGPPLTALGATVGLGIALQEAMRVGAGGGDVWLQPLYAEPLVTFGRADYPLQLSIMQSLVLGACLTLALLVGAAMRLSRFGREWRACADDPAMLALMGVDAKRVVALSAVASCVTASATGFMIAVHYGNVSFSTGFILALKALFVAVVGGLSAFGGVVAAGFLLGFAETGWSTFFPLEYRDVATFVVLTGFVILKR